MIVYYSRCNCNFHLCDVWCVLWFYYNRKSVPFAAAKRTSKTTMANIKAMLEQNGIKLTRNTVLSMMMTDSPSVALAQAWMERFFAMVGDPTPNREEIHLDSSHTVKSIYEEYINSVHRIFPEAITNHVSHKKLRNEYVSLTAFSNMWRLGFNNVKLRVFKQVLLHILSLHII